MVELGFRPSTFFVRRHCVISAASLFRLHALSAFLSSWPYCLFIYFFLLYVIWSFICRFVQMFYPLLSVSNCVVLYWLYFRSFANFVFLNLLTPNVNYSGRTAPLTSKVAFYIFIQQIYVLNILHMVYTLFFFSPKCSLFHNSNVFGSCIIHILYTECAKIKKK